MREIRAYTRDERKRLIIYVLAEDFRKGGVNQLTCAEIARAMNIRASTKLRKMLLEMQAEGVISIKTVSDAGIAGYRLLYSLNVEREAFINPHKNRKAEKRERAIRLNSAKGQETLVLQ